ncbi:unnamed protein product, partial [Sphenostylis stenocarpa]
PPSGRAGRRSGFASGGRRRSGMARPPSGFCCTLGTAFGASGRRSGFWVHRDGVRMARTPFPNFG